jgi:hypothetical protein
VQNDTFAEFILPPRKSKLHHTWCVTAAASLHQPPGVTMNTAVARHVDLSHPPRASLPAVFSRVLHDAVSIAGTAWEGVCNVSKANLLSQKHSGHAYRRRMRRL